MKLLFYEPNHSGHHFPYLARMLPGFFDLPIEIVLATTEEGAASPEYAANLAPLADRFTLDARCAPPSELKTDTARQRATELVEVAKDMAADHVFVAYADGLWQIMAMRRMRLGKLFEPGVGVEGILYRGGFTYPDATRLTDRLKRWLFRRMLRQGIFDRLLLDDEYLHEFADSVGGDRSRTRTVLTANPVTVLPGKSRTAARGELGLPTDGRIISLSGAIDRRKGADLLIDAFARALTSGLTDTRLLLAGPHKPDIRQRLDAADARSLIDQGRIICLDRLLNETDMFNVAAASDLVTAPYPNHSGRSSIILWAAAAGRPVLAVDRGCIAHVVETQSLGMTCSVRDTRSFSRAIVEAIDAPWTPQQAERSVAYARFHDVSNYQQINAKLVRERIESGPNH